MEKNWGDLDHINVIREVVNWDKTKRKKFVTPIYNDTTGDGEVISTINPIYDFTKMNRVGYVITDNYISELKHNASTILPSQKPWFSLYLTDVKRNTTCFYGKCGGVPIQHLDVSDAASVSIRFNAIEYFKSLQLYGFIALSILFSFSLLVFASRKATEEKLSHMDDELSGLKTREAIKFITPKKDSAVIVLDCNKFKVINDTYGHKMGDAAIKSIAEIIRGHIRKDDIAIRYGGDEFLIYLDSFGTYAGTIAKRIGDEIVNTPLVFNDNIINLSVSYGCADIKGTIEDAIALADQRMFIQKREIPPISRT